MTHTLNTCLIDKIDEGKSAAYQKPIFSDPRKYLMIILNFSDCRFDNVISLKMKRFKHVMSILSQQGPSCCHSVNNTGAAELSGFYA